VATQTAPIYIVGVAKRYLARITVIDTVKNIGKGMGSASPERGFAWYAGM
jgi:hypothetical protein